MKQTVAFLFSLFVLAAASSGAGAAKKVVVTTVKQETGHKVVLRKKGPKDRLRELIQIEKKLGAKIIPAFQVLKPTKEFAAFAKQEYSIENVLCWKTIQAFNEAKSDEVRTEALKQIVVLYVGLAGKKESEVKYSINVNENLRNVVRGVFKKVNDGSLAVGHSDVLGTVKELEDAVDMVLIDTYSRFRFSELYAVVAVRFAEARLKILKDEKDGPKVVQKKNVSNKGELEEAEERLKKERLENKVKNLKLLKKN